jgi:Excreted virulence factor EspC, type VII ESX diderm/Transglycosylase SLT domain
MAPPTLRVDPATLRSSANAEKQLASGVAGLGVGQPFADASNAMANLQTGAASHQAQAASEAAGKKLSDSLSKFSDNLLSAATQYEHTDGKAGGSLNDSGNKVPDSGNAPGQPAGPPPPPPPAAPAPTGPQPIPVDQVTYDNSGNPASGPDATRGYINQAMDKLGITDPAARERWAQGYMTMAEHESSYNPNAINNWDSNAKNSTGTVADGYGNGCSRGIVQCVPGTFAQYHQPGTSNDIYDPVANIAASMNYVMGRYHVSPDGSDLAAKVGQANPNTHQGY